MVVKFVKVVVNEQSRADLHTLVSLDVVCHKRIKTYCVYIRYGSSFVYIHSPLR